MQLEYNAACNRGSVRKNNEDMVLAADAFIRDAIIPTKYMDMAEESFLFAVSDGMGGHNAGEHASEFVLRRMQKMLLNLPGKIDDEALRELLDVKAKEIHNQLNDVGRQNASMQGLGCTFTGLLYKEGNFYLIHVGDSRLYRLRGKYIAQLTRDHSLRNMLNDDSIPPNTLGNCFGGGVSSFFYDFENLTDRLLPGDQLLLCSDGLSSELEDERMEELLLAGADASTLAARANECGGNDNIACIVLKILSNTTS